MARRRLISVGGLLVVGIIAVGWTVLRQRPKSAPPSNAAVEDELARLQSSIAKLQGEVAFNRALMRPQPVSAPLAAPDRNDSPATSQGTNPKTRAPTEVEIIGQLDEKFSQQAVDSGWS